MCIQFCSKCLKVRDQRNVWWGWQYYAELKSLQCTKSGLPPWWSQLSPWQPQVAYTVVLELCSIIYFCHGIQWLHLVCIQWLHLVYSGSTWNIVALKTRTEERNLEMIPSTYGQTEWNSDSLNFIIYRVSEIFWTQ